MKQRHKEKKNPDRLEREKEREKGGKPLFFQDLNTIRVYSVSGAHRHISTSISF